MKFSRNRANRSARLEAERKKKSIRGISPLPDWLKSGFCPISNCYKSLAAKEWAKQKGAQHKCCDSEYGVNMPMENWFMLDLARQPCVEDGIFK